MPKVNMRVPKISNRIICKDCEIEQNEQKYYLSRIVRYERMEVCKSCFKDKIIKNGVLEVFKKYDVPFLKKIWDISHNDLGTYMKNITLPQYSKLQWKDSILENEPETKLIGDKTISRKDDLYACCKVDLSNKFLIDSLIGLEEEYDLIPKTKDTLSTRKNLLDMITQLHKNIGIR